MTGRAPTHGENWYALVDAAQDSSLYELVTQSIEWQCLIGGHQAPELLQVLPYLVRLQPGDPLIGRWQSEGTGLGWGIQFRSGLPIDRLRLHFKKFLTARLPDGRTVMFRFYDPLIFRAYMRMASAEERRPWFEGISLYSAEGDEPGVRHVFSLIDGRLHDGGVPVA
jgi:hypothetical protein